MPDRLERWHRYAIQQHVDGAVAIIIDGRVFWRSPPISEAGMELPDSAYVALGYRSFQTTIAHGPLAVYDQPKYVVESNSGATDAARVP